MICPKCKDRDTVGETKLCDPCRLKKWRKDNPEKVKAYYEMRKDRDKEKELLTKIRNYFKDSDHIEDVCKDILISTRSDTQSKIFVIRGKPLDSGTVEEKKTDFANMIRSTLMMQAKFCMPNIKQTGVQATCTSRIDNQ